MIEWLPPYQGPGFHRQYRKNQTTNKTKIEPINWYCTTEGKLVKFVLKIGYLIFLLWKPYLENKTLWHTRKESIGGKMKKVCVLLLLSKLLPYRSNIFIFGLSSYVTSPVCHLAPLSSSSHSEIASWLSGWRHQSCNWGKERVGGWWPWAFVFSQPRPFWRISQPLHT